MSEAPALVALLYSSHRVWKYAQSSLEPPPEIVGRLYFSAGVVGADAGLAEAADEWWARSCISRSLKPNSYGASSGVVKGHDGA